MDEQALIREAQKGDNTAFLSLLERYDRQIMSVVYRFTGNLYDRDDLYQEVFLHCFQSLKSYRFQASFSTWLYRVALNRCISYMKKHRNEEAPVEGVAPHADWEHRAKVRAVKSALNQLAGNQHLCFHLFYIEGWEMPDICRLLSCSEGAVKSHLNRARNKIRRNREVLKWQTNPN